MTSVAHPSPEGPIDDRSALALAYQWAARIMVIALEMVVPGVAGYWLDSQLGLPGVFVILGFLLGMAVGMLHLLHIARKSSKNP